MSSIWRTLDRGTLRAIALVCLADAIVGASFGAITVSGGLPAWVPIVMSLLIFAGGAQFAAAAVLIAGGSPVAAVIAGLVLNTRLLPYGFTVADAIGGRPGKPGQSWLRLLGAHVITDESVAFTMQLSEPGQRRAAFWTSGLGLFLCWNVAVALGVFVGKAMPNPDSFGLDAAFPAVILALVLPSLTNRATGSTSNTSSTASTRTTRNAALAGAAIAVAATPVLPAGFPVLLALAGLILAVRSPKQSPAPAPAPAPAHQSAPAAPATPEAPEAPEAPETTSAKPVTEAR